MIKRIIAASAVAAMAAAPALADFSYQRKTTITGGMAASAMKMAAVFSKQAGEPVVENISIKGDRMVTRTQTHMTVIDLAAETITTGDLQKKTYSVMTFAQMKQMMEQASEKMQSKKDPNQPDMQFKVSVNDTGVTKQVAGMDAKERVIKIEMQTTDPKTGQTGSMFVIADTWIGPDVPGYKELRDFQKRMGEKIMLSAGGNALMGRPDLAKGMANMQSEMAKLEGVQLMTVTTMTGANPATVPTGQPAQSQPQPEQTQAQQEKPSIAGALGKLGGFSRKKQTNQNPDAPAQSNASVSGSLLESTTESSGFNSAPVDESQFAVPSGFKKVEADARRK